MRATSRVTSRRSGTSWRCSIVTAPKPGATALEITVTRLGSLFLTSNAEETRLIRDFVTDAAGPEAANGFTIGEPDDVVAAVGELVDAGVDEFYFNLPLADPDGITAAGKLLTSSFA